MNAKNAQAAIYISDGACNPRGVARALVEACDDDKDSAACKLIVHQLYFILTRQDPIPEAWADWRKECEEVIANGAR